LGSPGAEILIAAKPAADDVLREGHYAAKQIFCQDRLVAWSHRRRFELGLRLARRFAGKRILDYGCGDGTFLALLQAGPAPVAEGVGAELDEVQVVDCRSRLSGRPGLNFELIERLAAEQHHGAYDGVVCMEVLEHVVAVDTVIERLDWLLGDHGTLLVSVPVETGLPLLAKQAARRIAGWRGIGDYPGTSPYTLQEYLASIVAGAASGLPRVVYQGTAGPFHDHKGFNWMALRERLARVFDIQQTLASPVPFLGPHLATQVWFVCTKQRGKGDRT
jgi:SAM-dependent methyltransferase